MESSLFKKLHNESDIKKLNFVNTWVNGIAYRSDIIKVVKMINGDTGPKSKKWKSSKLT